MKSDYGSGFKIAASIFQKLLEAVEDAGGTDADVRQLETNSGLRKKVGELIAGVKQSATSAFQAIVNYDRSVSLGIQAGKYNWTNDNITDQNFPPEKGESGSKEISFELVHPNKVVSSEQALQELDNQGLRPATLRELLAFGETYPDEQRKYPIVALGSVWRWHGDRSVPCLYVVGGVRILFLYWYDGGWFEDYRFLAVRK